MLSTSSFKPTQKQRLGEVLLQLGFLTQAELATMISQHRGPGMSFGKAAVAQGLCSEDQVTSALSRQLGLEVVNLDAQHVDSIALLPKPFALKHRAVAIERGVRTPEVVVALAAPARLDTQDAVRAVVGTRKVRFVLAADAALDRAPERLYGSPEATPTPALRPAEPAGALELSPRTVDVIAREAKEQNVTPREIMRRALESWASTRRAF